MKLAAVVVASVSLLALGPPAARAAQEEAKAEVRVPDRAALEADFARRMQGAKLVGFFTDDRAGAGKELSEETYTFGKLEKLEGDRWRIEAGMAYGGRSFSFPIVVEILWAGDTPVLSITDLAIPLVGTFTARVVFHGERYAGIWSAPDHGGQMFGRVVRAAPESEGGAPAAPAPGPGEQRSGALEHGLPPDPESWPSFRGRHARGVADGHATAEDFEVESGRNLRWRVPVAGLAHSSPVVHGERVFLTSAIKEGGAAELTVGLYGSIAPVKDEGVHEFVVLCIDARDGSTVWSRTAWQGIPHFPRHPKGSFAASTPATDGTRVVAFFGSEGLYCYDVAGELVWKRDFGPLSAGFFMVPDAQWGFASSPVIHEGKLFVQVDVLGDSFVAALDLASGEEIWSTKREDVPTWSTPTVVIGEAWSQLVCNGFKHMGGYDLETGEELWKLSGAGDIPVPTPVEAHGLIFLTSAHGLLAPIYAVSANAMGELTRDHEAIRWKDMRRGIYMQTPLVYGAEIYLCNDAGVLTCYDAVSGTEHYRQRLGEGRTGFTASGVAADGKLYFTSEAGAVHVVQAGTAYAPLVVSELGEECMATPAVHKGTIYWRTRGHLVAVAPE